MTQVPLRSSRARRVAQAVIILLGLGAAAALIWHPWAERGGDLAYDISVREPALAARRPRVAFDEGHNNSHSASGRFAPFANLLRADGCRVRSFSGALERDMLADVDILVIVNAAGPEERREDSAFSEMEIATIKEWVEAGGSLLLAADHHPYGSAAALLARTFGVTMIGGWCDDPANRFAGTADTGAVAYARERGMIGDHPITHGRNEMERVGTVVTFTGQSLLVPEADGVSMLLRCAASAVDQVPVSSTSETVGGVTRTTFETSETSASGHAQGLAFKFGKGRIVIVGEAAMLSAQIDAQSGLKFSMNVPGADNRLFVLNTVRWLAGEL